jgi:hypothetical protein
VGLPASSSSSAAGNFRSSSKIASRVNIHRGPGGRLTCDLRQGLGVHAMPEPRQFAVCLLCGVPPRGSGRGRGERCGRTSRNLGKVAGREPRPAGRRTQGRGANLCTKLCTRPRSILADARSRCERRRSVVGVAGFEPATPSSRTRSEAGRSLKIQRFSSRSRTFVRIRFARSCGRTCGRRTIGVGAAGAPSPRRPPPRAPSIDPE